MESSSMNPPPNRRESEEPLLTATRKTLESFHEDVQYLWCSDIPVYENPPSALNFLRNHVALSRPCIIRNSILTTRPPGAASESDNDIPLTMTLDELVRLFPKAETTVHGGNASPPGKGALPPLCVDVTPDGHGDCLRRVAMTEDRMPEHEEERVFVKPLEREMSLPDFCRRLRRGRAKQQQQQQQVQQPDEILDKVFESSLEENSDESGSDGDDNLFEDCVLYYSRQNDCLREELSPLWNLKRTFEDTSDSSHDTDKNDDDGDSFVFPRSFPWAEEAFFGSSTPGAQVGPDAVNLWMGDERAVSAMHKDHYENLFYVLSGEKVFGLCPPSDAPFLYEREVLSGRFEVSGGNEGDQGKRKWSVLLDREEKDDNPSLSSATQYSKVHWIATDLFGSHADRTDHDREFPLSKYAHPITVRVRAGELLYLPSLWFHRVTQTRETVGINYWYDMNFESPTWCYFHLLQQLQSPSDEGK